MTDSKTSKAEGEMGSPSDESFAWTEPEAPTQQCRPAGPRVADPAPGNDREPRHAGGSGRP